MWIEQDIQIVVRYILDIMSLNQVIWARIYPVYISLDHLSWTRIYPEYIRLDHLSWIRIYPGYISLDHLDISQPDSATPMSVGWSHFQGSQVSWEYLTESCAIHDTCYYRLEYTHPSPSRLARSSWLGNPLFRESFGHSGCSSIPCCCLEICTIASLCLVLQEEIEKEAGFIVTPPRLLTRHLIGVLFNCLGLWAWAWLFGQHQWWGRRYNNIGLVCHSAVYVGQQEQRVGVCQQCYSMFGMSKETINVPSYRASEQHLSALK